MELFFGEFIKQLIAAILALFMPFTSIGTAISNNAAQSRTTITVPSVSQEAEALASWDVSDTENDNVTMTYYGTPKEQTTNTEDTSVIDNITSSITSLFTPMTAYAAEAVPTIAISGDGATEPLLFLKWLKADEFVPYYESWCAQNKVNANSYYVAKDGIDEQGHIVGTRISAAQAHTGFASYEDMLDVYFPIYLMDIVKTTNKFWETYGEFAPRMIIIDGNVDKISFGAFAFCPNIKRIIIETTAETFTVESEAFAGTSIRSVEFPRGTKEIPLNLFESCTSLQEVYLPDTITSIANYAFNDMAANSVIYCGSNAVMNLLADPDASTPQRQSEDGTEEEDPANYDNFDAAKTTLALYEAAV